MIQTGIFTGYFPYGLKETAERIRRLTSTPSSSTSPSRTWISRPARSPRKSAEQSARSSAITTCRSAAYPATRISFTRTRTSASDSSSISRPSSVTRAISVHPMSFQKRAPSRPTAIGSTIPRTRRRKGSKTASTSSATSSGPPTITAPSSCSKPTSTTSSARSTKPCACFRRSTTAH